MMHAVEGEVCVWGGGRTVVSHTQFLLKFASPSARTRTHARASIFGHEAATAIISSGHKAATAIISSGHEAATAIISSGHEAATAIISSDHEAATAIISNGHEAATAIISSGHEAATAIISSGHVQLSIIHVGHVHNTTIPVTSNK